MTAHDVFDQAYDELLSRWPPHRSEDVPTRFGTTRVNTCGEGPPLLLLAGHGATSTAWTAAAPALANHYHVLAVDALRDAGRSHTAGEPIRDAAGYCVWLDELLDGFGITATAIAAHSYGAWIALRYAIHAPRRVSKLTLIDPTESFARLSPRYLMHALPALVGPTPARMTRFLRWETHGADLDPTWLTLAATAVTIPQPRPIRPRRATPAELATVALPTTVLLAEHSRAHNITAVAAAARAIPQVTITMAPTATHHTLPMSPVEPVITALTN